MAIQFECMQSISLSSSFAAASGGRMLPSHYDAGKPISDRKADINAQRVFYASNIIKSLRRENRKPSTLVSYIAPKLIAEVYPPHSPVKSIASLHEISYSNLRFPSKPPSTKLPTNMGSDEYTAITGGTLKLKGVKDARIAKPKKRNNKKKTTTTSTAGVDEEEQKDNKVESGAGVVVEKSPSRQKVIDRALAEEEMNRREEEQEEEEEDFVLGAGKTEAERRYEERRRKRVWVLRLFL